MSQIIPLLNYEEGYREAPYYDSLGFPTAGTGILLGPKGAPISHYTFTVPKEVSDVWLQNIVNKKIEQMRDMPEIWAAMTVCNGPRQDILISMAYQMGVKGLAKFVNTLALIAAGNFTGAAAGMLTSTWAQQTPARAKRHAEVMRTGTFTAYQGAL